MYQLLNFKIPYTQAAKDIEKKGENEKQLTYLFGDVREHGNRGVR
jgi:hypothetical protein